MSVEVINNGECQVLICNTTDEAFGAVFGMDEDVFDFLEWLDNDARSYQQHHLVYLTNEWRKKVEAAA